MNKIYYLKTCDTCQRILKQLPLQNFELQDIKSNPITVMQLDSMQQLAGSYEALFSRRAKKYHQMGLKNQSLTEQDYRRLLLDEYTFLKRPVVLLGTEIFVGSSKKNVQNLLDAVQKTRTK
ncbi:MAG TPA: arsenate reductase [Saprospiraceae bacterium]|nr:arsenate reductase [Saprospiraceae bacterium]